MNEGTCSGKSTIRLLGISAERPTNGLYLYLFTSALSAQIGLQFILRGIRIRSCALPVTDINVGCNEILDIVKNMYYKGQGVFWQIGDNILNKPAASKFVLKKDSGVSLEWNWK
jgi:hypothetical protein